MNLLSKWSSILPILIIVPLLLWSLNQFSWQDFTNLIAAFTLNKILLLVILNIFIFGLFTFRWSIINATLAEGIPFYRLFIYRLIGYGISYFTPGPQIGGEPAQIILLKQHHNISSENAFTSVYIDRLVDLLVNFTILALGLVVLLTNPTTKNMDFSIYHYWFFGLLIISIGYMVLLFTGKLTFKKIINSFRSQIKNKKLFAILETLSQAETLMSIFVRKFPISFLFVLLTSIITWGFMIFEYWLMLFFMGIKVDGSTLISAITAARLAFLTPLPGGFGALEAGQIWVMQLLGFSTSIGISAAIYIRIRDSILGFSGLLFGASYLPKRRVMKEAKI